MHTVEINEMASMAMRDNSRTHGKDYTYGGAGAIEIDDEVFDSISMLVDPDSVEDISMLIIRLCSDNSKEAVKSGT